MDLWLMSCRVLKRDMEQAMLDAVVERAQSRGIRAIVGHYIPTAKNGMVKEFYATLGFAPIPLTDATLPEGSTAWRLSLANYKQQNTHIKVLEFMNA
jgi:predicted enzyme involved in methoxymalonyl-ACP biosynthesis